MATTDLALTDQAEEDSYHKLRLLAIEQKPLQRVTKRLLGNDSLIYKPATQLPSPPPDGDAGDEAQAQHAAQVEERRKWREEMLCDFAMLQGTMVRIQLLRNGNEKERERYAAEKIKILETAQAIRDNTSELRTQLEEAQNTLETRKGWDALAERILSNRLLKPREEQHAQLLKLEQEISELENEAEEYRSKWKGRRMQFQKLAEEGRQMQRLIREEKEEAERKEGMEGNEDGDEVDTGTATQDMSRVGTPRPETDGNTPLAHSQPGGSSTPARTDRLLPIANASGSGSRAPSPSRSTQDVAEGKDIDAAETPASHQQVQDEVLDDETEEGEATPTEEQMELT